MDFGFSIPHRGPLASAEVHRALIAKGEALGDAWYPTGRNPKLPLDTVERFAVAIGRMRGMAERAGRDPSSVGVSTSVRWEPDAMPAGDGGRALFTGADADVAADLAAFRDLGIGAIGVDVTAADGIAEAEDRMERFMRGVVPLVGCEGPARAAASRID